MATSVSATGCVGSSFYGSWGTSMVGEDYTMLVKSVPSQVRVGRGKPVRFQPMMKNVNEGKGIFAPAVVITRNIIGKKRFNQLRGKAIALHSQVITEFCKSIGADAKQRQGLIRLAKKNGEWLGTKFTYNNTNFRS
ncbi:Protein PROTON GRADIENT REGULATION 5, chloroplastic [Mucuna pruriens]|uniref:Protein PROTON GRADIENT REGULATION 5, chloroplastic n=1 Tax=Mucuna pruriens TaxID=157652 RepID=A0A371GWX2_MUCPR|nr:Protein PROTON GRADIENT REGULATION 5, chloroplastic [Mucuna pruriens]